MTRACCAVPISSNCGAGGVSHHRYGHFGPSTVPVPPYLHYPTICCSPTCMDRQGQCQQYLGSGLPLVDSIFCQGYQPLLVGNYARRQFQPDVRLVEHHGPSVASVAFFLPYVVTSSSYSSAVPTPRHHFPVAPAAAFPAAYGAAAVFPHQHVEHNNHQGRQHHQLMMQQQWVHHQPPLPSPVFPQNRWVFLANRHGSPIIKIYDKSEISDWC